MPYSQLTVEEAAKYLHIDIRELNKLVRKKEIPFAVIRGQTLFRKSDLRDWSTQRILTSKANSLNEFHSKILKKQQTLDHRNPFLFEMVSDDCFIDCIPVKSKAKILRCLADKAFETGGVCDAIELFELLQKREELCPTGLESGVAVPHTRIHSEYLFLENFLIIGRVLNGVPFGSMDGKLTNLFFMPCIMDDELHLYTLSRIVLILQKTDIKERLMGAASAGEMHEALIECEEYFVENFVDK